MILNRANHDHECNICHRIIKKSEHYLNQLHYKSGSSKYCIDCIRLEVIAQ